MKQLPNIEDIINKWALDDGDLLYEAAIEAMKEYGRKVRNYTLDLAAKESKKDSDWNGWDVKGIITTKSILKLKKDKRLQI